MQCTGATNPLVSNWTVTRHGPLIADISPRPEHRMYRPKSRCIMEWRSHFERQTLPNNRP